MCGLCFDDGVAASEKRQTVIHELSHFNHVGINEQSSGSTIGERDFGYGESNCQELARTNPTTAMNNADNVGYFVRDIGLGSDPDCKDSYAKCSSWTSQYGCDSSVTVGGQSLKQACPMSCNVCTPQPLTFADGTTVASAAAATVAPTPAAPTPAPTQPVQHIEQEMIVTGLSVSSYSGSVKTVYETAYAISLGLYDTNTNTMMAGCVITSTAMAPVASAPANKVLSENPAVGEGSEIMPSANISAAHSEMLSMPEAPAVMPPPVSLVQISLVEESEVMPPPIPKRAVPKMPRMPPVMHLDTDNDELQLLEATTTPTASAAIDFRVETTDKQALSRAESLTPLTFVTNVQTSNSIAHANVVVPTEEFVNVAAPTTSADGQKNTALRQTPGMVVALVAILAIAVAQR